MLLFLLTIVKNHSTIKLPYHKTTEQSYLLRHRERGTANEIGSVAPPKLCVSWWLAGARQLLRGVFVGGPVDGDG